MEPLPRQKTKILPLMANQNAVHRKTCPRKLLQLPSDRRGLKTLKCTEYFILIFKKPNAILYDLQSKRTEASSA